MICGIELPDNFVENKDLRNICTTIEMVDNYDWQSSIGRSITADERLMVIETVLNSNVLLNRGREGSLPDFIDKLEDIGLSKNDAYGVIIKLASGAKITDEPIEKYTALLRVTNKIYDLKGKSINPQVSEQDLQLMEMRKIDSKDDELMSELHDMLVSEETIEKKDTRNLYTAKKIVEIFDKENCIGRNLTQREKGYIIESIVGIGKFDSGKGCFLLSSLVSNLKDVGLSDNEMAIAIIKLSGEQAITKEKSPQYSLLIGSAEVVSELKGKEIDTSFSELNLQKIISENLTQDEKDNLIKKMLDMGITEEFLNTQDIRNIYMANYIVNTFNWEHSIGRNLSQNEKRSVIQRMLDNCAVRKSPEGTINTLSSLSINLYDIGLTEDKVKSAIMNLAINGTITEEKGLGYSALVGSKALVDKLEGKKLDLEISENSIQIAQVDSITPAENKKVINELIELGVTKEEIDSVHQTNLHTAYGILSEFDWQGSIGRVLDSDEKKCIMQLLLKNTSLKRGRNLLSLIHNFKGIGLSEEEAKSAILKLAITGKVVKKGTYNYNALTASKTKVEELRDKELNFQITEEDIANVKSRYEKVMKRALGNQKGKLSELSSTLRELQYLCPEQNKVQDANTDEQIPSADD